MGSLCLDMLFRNSDEKKLTVSGIVAGVSNATIEYIFRADNRLHEAVYELPYGDFDTLFFALQQKYGEPNASEQWITALNSRVITGRMEKYNTFAFFDSSVAFTGSVWMLAQDDGSYVSIDIEELHSKKFKKNVYIIYACFTEEEYSAITGYTQQISDDL